MTSTNDITTLAGRILISVMFLISGFFKVGGYAQIVGYATAMHLPAPGVAIAVAAAIELACGLAILAGFKTRFAAWLLFLYLIPVTYFFHNFWAVQGQEQQTQMINFLKNVSIMGGLLVLSVNGAGGYSADGALAKKG
ncbi:MAG: DoxX family protein [Candidatus Acidiferrales bacterium]